MALVGCERMKVDFSMEGNEQGSPEARDRECRWCTEKIQQRVIVCPKCRRDQNKYLGWLTRWMPISIVFAAIGVALAIFGTVKTLSAAAEAETAKNAAELAQYSSESAAQSAKQSLDSVKKLTGQVSNSMDLAELVDINIRYSIYDLHCLTSEQHISCPDLKTKLVDLVVSPIASEELRGHAGIDRTYCSILLKVIREEDAADGVLKAGQMRKALEKCKNLL